MQNIYFFWEYHTIINYSLDLLTFVLDQMYLHFLEKQLYNYAPDMYLSLLL